jgi:hypothetical protein
MYVKLRWLALSMQIKLICAAGEPIGNVEGRWPTKSLRGFIAP